MMTKRELYPSETQDRFIVRLPDGMRERIKAAADANNRSMNSEIVARLQASFDAFPKEVQTRGGALGISRGLPPDPDSPVRSQEAIDAFEKIFAEFANKWLKENK